MISMQVVLTGIAGVAAVTGLALGGYVYRYVDAPPAKPFGISTVAGGAWATVTIPLSLTTNRQLLAVFLSLGSVAATVVVVYFFIFVSIYTDTDRVTVSHHRVLKAIGVVLGCTWILNVGVPVFQTVPTVVTVNGIQYPVVQSRPGRALFVGFLYVLSLGAVGLLLRFFITSRLYRRETLAILAITLVGLGSNVAFRAGLSPHPGLDVTPLSYTVQLLLMSYVLFYREFLDLDRIAADIVVDEITDPVVVSNGDGEIIEANAAANRTFSAGAADGITPTDLPDTPDEGPVRGEPDGGVVEYATEGDHPTHIFSMNLTTISDQFDRKQGELRVYRDITQQERARQRIEEQQVELELYRQIVDRILRHNIRNQMTVVRGHTELIESSIDDDGRTPAVGEIREHIAAITEATETLQSVSENARQLGQLIDNHQADTTVALDDTAREVVEESRQEFPDATIRVVDTSPSDDTPTVETVQGVEYTLANLVENAVVHNDGEPRVEVRIEQNPPRFVVSDNGPGIPDYEIEAIGTENESQLQHGSGAGLWLAERVATYSGGNLSISSTESGAEVTLAFDER